MEDVLIIGAGTAGLGLAYELKRRGVVPAMIDQGSRVAQVWRGRHPQLRLNTPSRTSHQPGMKIPRERGAYLHRDDYIRYLEDYYEFLGVPARFNVAARRVDAAEDHWRISTDQGEIAARHVVVCTGPEKMPWSPSWPGMEAFRGQIIHAADLGEAADFAGRRVLIAGGGNSGVDVGNALADVDLRDAWISVRSGSTIVPRFVLGRPSQEYLIAIQHTPLFFQDAFVRLVSQLTMGDLSRYGIPRPPAGPVSRQFEDGVAIAIDDGFVAALKRGRFKAVPAIASLSAKGVTLADGRVIDPDVIICATGYRPGLEGLVGHLGVLDGDGRLRSDLGKGERDPVNLWFHGLGPAPYGNMYVRRREAAVLARRIARSLQ